MPPFWVLWLIICVLAFVCLYVGFCWRVAVDRPGYHPSPWARRRDRRHAELLILAGALLTLTAFLSSALIAIPVWGWI
jgi:hypothetical protein